MFMSKANSYPLRCYTLTELRKEPSLKYALPEDIGVLYISCCGSTSLYAWYCGLTAAFSLYVL